MPSPIVSRLRGVLPAAWLALSILWVDGAWRAHRHLSHLGGPGAGGAVLALPFLIVAGSFGVLGLAVALLLRTPAARPVALLAGGLGLLGTTASLPFVLATMIYVGLVLAAGGWPAAIAIVLSPLLFAATLIDGVLPPASTVGGRRALLVAALAALLVAAVGPR